MAHFFPKQIKKMALVGLLLLSFSSVATTSAVSLCDEISEGTKGFFSCGQEQTSLTDFKGGLNTPDAAGYSPGLTQATNVRDYIKNIVNFALGFLGILAVVIIIYGGFLYVTAAGKEEQAGKGKKSIEYALIGILIILASFAIVNTILSAPSGKEDQTLNGAAPAGSSNQNANRRAFFNYAAITVQTVAHDFVTAYQNYAEINVDLDTLNNIESEQNIKTPSGLKSIIQNKKNILTNVLNKAGSLSQVAEKSQKALLIYDKYLQLSDKATDQMASQKDEEAGSDLWEQFWLGTNYTNYKNEIETETGENGLKKANAQDFALAVEIAHDKLVDLYERVHAAAAVGEVDAAFKEVFTNFNLLVPLENPVKDSASALNAFAAIFYDVTKAQQGLSLNEKAANNATILKIVSSIGTLYEKVKNVQFVYAAISADVTEGNAPLVVNFDGLRSLDPNNHTLPSNSFTWDFGDSDGCQHDPGKGTGIIAMYTFCKPGTYIVKLQVKAPPLDKSQGEIQQTAAGVAYQTIVVKPPSSRINLDASINGKILNLSQYDKEGRQIKNIQDMTVTKTEAKDGFILDASKTETGEGKSFQSLAKTSVAKVKWDFGDKSNLKNIVEGPPDTISQTQKVAYNTEGAYRITLEVTDDRAMTDRKLINVLVNSLAARINVEPGTQAHLGDNVTFDGSASSSDNGQIKTYEWKVTKEASGAAVSKDITPANLKNVDNFKYKFMEPGQYKVSLTVNDGSKDATADVQINIESKPPVAQFSFDNPDKTQPHTYIFDAKNSYDPDGSGDLAYKWEINAAPGDCVYIDGSSQSDCTTAFKEFSTAKKLIKAKFKFKKGKYAITLDVQDPAEPGKSIPSEQELVVENDLDVGWGDDGKPITTQLKDGSATVSFSIKTTNGTSYELNTGDDQKESGTIEANPMIIKHTYDKSGTFPVKLTIFDNEDNENSTVRKVFIAPSNTPIAAIGLTMDGESVLDTSGVLKASRKTVITFDAGKSLNVDGTGRRLIYSWDFGDGEKSSKKQPTHTYKELSPKDSKFYKVTLKVANEENAAQISKADEALIDVTSLYPSVRGITAIPVKTDLITPVTVNLTANGATDLDGKIVSYRWSYYDVSAPDEELGLQITQSPNTTLTIGTRGEEGIKKSYAFALLVTDDENKTFNTKEELNADLIPTLEVTNGPNKAPTAKFNVDRSSIMVGETINFSSSSTDPNPGGTITKYIWDFEGEGFGAAALNNEYNKANISYTYTKPHKDGVRVRLKVINNNGAESVSDSVPIYVDAKSAPPIAAFTSKQLDGKKIQFANNSTADIEAGANTKNQTWDFDVKTDTNGDGIPDNDLDSTEANPVREYADYGIYRAKLNVEDDQGNKTSITNFVNVKAPALTPPPAEAPSENLEARLTSLPVPNVADGRIHLQGDKGSVIFNFSDSKGNIKLYTIDKNIYFDSNGNGIKDDDQDYQATGPGTWSAQFSKSDGSIRVRLTLTDDTAKKSTVEKDIVFDLPPPPTNGKTSSLMGL